MFYIIPPLRFPERRSILHSEYIHRTASLEKRDDRSARHFHNHALILLAPIYGSRAKDEGLEKGVLP
jgi:hypothetical protein